MYRSVLGDLSGASHRVTGKTVRAKHIFKQLSVGAYVSSQVAQWRSSKADHCGGEVFPITEQHHILRL